MLLQRLVEYAKRRDLPPTGYDKVPIRWIVDLDSKLGTTPNFVSTTKTGKKNDRGDIRLAPFRERTGTKIAPKLFADDGEYTFGIAKEGKKGDRAVHARNCQNEYIKLLELCAQETGVSAVAVVCNYLKNWDQKWQLPDDFSQDMNITFRVDGELLIDNPKIRAFWAEKFWAYALEEKDEEESDDEEGNINVTETGCHICGRVCQPIPRHPFKIKPIPNGQKKGNAIISANKNAFTSYGLNASLIAPTCKYCVEDYAKAANALLDGVDTHITVGSLAYIFWTKEETGFSFASILSKPEPGEVQALIESAFGGHQAATKLDVTPFYATAFSASGARVAVRDWLDTTVEGVRQNIARYFKLQQLVEGYGDKGKPIGLYALAACTVRDANKELAPNVPKALLHCALKGGPLPKSLLFQAVKRNRAEQTVTRPRAALIKMVLLSQNTNIEKEDKMEQLDVTNKEPAYLCGRLLGVLEAVQRAAMPGANTTIVDRFYGTASSAPASVFGRLLRGAQPHLSKLRKEKRGTFEALEKKLEEIQYPGLVSFPKTLTLEEQGLFALGYYHQRASDRAGAAAYIKNQQDKNIND